MVMFGRRLQWNDIRCVALIMTAAAGILYAFHFQGVNSSPAESGRAALSFLKHGRIADPFVIATGPTAQVSPPMTLLLAAVYDVCGGNDPAARIILSIVSTAAYVLCVGLTLATCRALNRSSRIPELICILLCLLVPVSLYSFVIGMRQYEQPIASALLMLALYVWADGRACRATEGSGWVVLGILGGFAGLLSPAILPPFVLTIGSQRWSRHWSWGRIGGALTLVVAVMALWTVRNEIVFSKLVLTRSNFGLELAIGNNDRATGYYSPLTFAHPSDVVAEADRVRTLGELEYMHGWSMQAKAWILAHPVRFLTLTARRIGISFFPRSALVGQDPLLGRALFPLMLILGAMKLAALCVVAWYRARVVMWLNFTMLPLLVYFVTHINARYEVVTFFPTVCLIACALCLARERSVTVRASKTAAEDQPTAPSVTA